MTTSSSGGANVGVSDDAGGKKAAEILGSLLLMKSDR
jgi:hypothetical protein